jgi:hypothetical protein
VKPALLGAALAALVACGGSGGTGLTADAGSDGTMGGSSGGSSGSGSSSGAGKDGSGSGSGSGGSSSSSGGSSSGGAVTCSTPSTSYQMNGSNCGTFRWAVKTGTDDDVTSVNMTPQMATIANLVKLPTVTGSSCSRVSGEKQVYELKNIIIQFEREESDSDYHLVLFDPSTGSEMIGEIPYPGCAGHDSCQTGNPWLCEITRARAALDANDPSLSTGDRGTGTVIGVGFFDTYEGMMATKPTGMAPNSLELHPVLAVCFGQDCDPLAGY